MGGKRWMAWGGVMGVLLLILASAACWGGAKNEVAYVPREGDVVFQSLPSGPMVSMIEGATKSPYSHCGIVAPEGQGWVVWEALGTVHATPLEEFLGRGRGGFYEVYRFKGEDKELGGKVVEKAKGYAGRPYDARYRMDDESIYCSELIYKAYEKETGKKLGVLVKVKDLDWQPYEKLIRRLEGDGSLPLEREMITPRDLAKAEGLEKVYSSEMEEGRSEK